MQKISEVLKRLIYNKFFVLVMGFAALAAISRPIHYVSLPQRAIVCLLGLAKTAEGDYEMHVQVVKPAATLSGSSASTTETYVVFSQTNKSIGECFDAIKVQTGLRSTLSYCGAVIVHRSAVDDDFPAVLSSLMDEWRLPERTTAYYTEDDVKEIVSTAVPLTSMGGTYIQKAAQTNNESLGFHNNMIKNMLIGYGGKCETYTMGMLELQPIEKSDIGADIGSRQSNLSLFKFDKAVAVKKGEPPVVMSDRDGMAMCLIHMRGKSGRLTVESGGTTAHFELAGIKTKIKLKGDKLMVEVKALAKLLELVEPQTIYDIKDFGQRFVTDLNDQIVKIIGDAFKKSQDLGYDFFNVADMQYQQQGMKWKREPDYLQKITIEVKADITAAN